MYIDFIRKNFIIIIKKIYYINFIYFILKVIILIFGETGTLKKNCRRLQRRRWWRIKIEKKLLINREYAFFFHSYELRTNLWRKINKIKKII